jgi:2,4-dienoyl-CoA reductase-like NADH-dependent reductase (Old Yellow Enzyme family)
VPVDLTLIGVGGLLPGSQFAVEHVEDGVADLLAFGANFIANPDLPHRLATGAPLAQADRATFFGGGDQGYIDYRPLKSNGEAGAPGTQP